MDNRYDRAMEVILGAVLGMLGSAIVGVILWLYLPRGVVLIRSELTEALDTWTLTNTSALPVELVSVDATGSVSDFGGRVAVPLAGLKGVAFHLPHREIWFEDWSADPNVGWGQVVLEPGDVLVVHVPVNADVIVKYRRAGWAGRFESRSIALHGTT